MSSAGRHDAFDSRRLWSLWDMLRIYARPFLEARNLVRTMTMATISPQVESFHQSARDHIRVNVTNLIEQLDQMGLPISVGRARAILPLIERLDLKPSDLHGYFNRLDDLIEEEIEAVCLLCLSASEAHLFDPKIPAFGQEVNFKFPSAVYEIEEAGKCLGLGRSTASAFHSIRCLETAIRALARCLGIPDPTKAAERNWGKVLEAIKSEVGKRWPTSTDRMAGDGQIFDELHAALAAIQNP